MSLPFFNGLRSRGSHSGGRLARARSDRLILGVGAAVVVAVLVAGVALLYDVSHQGKQITAYFAESIGVYQGSTVRVLGVPVGTVDAIQPDGSRVKVTMTIDHGIAIPASAGAVVVAPSVVADRYIQLTPAYTGGAQLADGAVIPVTRTAVPIEVDQIYSSLAKLLNALNGANKNGALSQLIKTGTANLNGNGANLRAMITQFSGLARTLGGSAGNMFATLSYLAQFTAMLKANDGQVRLAEDQLAQVSTILADERQNLSAAISDLAVALGQVKDFIASNRGLLTDNVNKLAQITTLLVQERDSLAQALNVAPLAVDNFVGAYDSVHHTIDGRGDLLELIKGSGTSAFTTAYLGAPPGSISVPLSAASKLPPLPFPVAGTLYGTPDALLAGGAK